MDSEEKQYAVLQNVVFCEQEPVWNNNFNLLPLSSCSGDFASLPSTSDIFGYYEHRSMENWSDRVYPVVYETANKEAVENKPKFYESMKKTMGRINTPLKSINNNIDTTRESAPNTVSCEKAKKPNLSFLCLIGLAFRNGKEKSLAVKEIYCFIETVFPFYNNASAGWRSSVRHNLSFSSYFVKLATEKSAGKTRGYIWRVNPLKEMELNRLIDCALEREKNSTMNALVNADYYLPLKFGRLRWDVDQLLVDSVDMNIAYFPESQNINSQYLTMDSKSDTYDNANCGSSILSALLGINDSVF